MQRNHHDYLSRKLVALPCLISILAVIFSSATMAGAAPPLIPQATPNIATASNQVITLELNGAALLYSGKYNESISYYDKALSMNPSDISALIGKGLAIGGLGKSNESITYYDQALAIDPKALGALTAKGLALSRLGKINEAITYFDKALAIDPKYPAAVYEKEIVLAGASKSAVTNKS